MIKEVAVRAYKRGWTLVAPNGTTYKLELSIDSGYSAYLIIHKDLTGLISGGYYSHIYYTDSPPYGENWKVKGRLNHCLCFFYSSLFRIFKKT